MLARLFPSLARLDGGKLMILPFAVFALLFTLSHGLVLAGQALGMDHTDGSTWFSWLWY